MFDVSVDPHKILHATLWNHADSRSQKIGILDNPDQSRSVPPVPSHSHRVTHSSFGSF